MFKHPDTGVIVVMWQGRKIAQYNSMDEFVDDHLAGIEALERKQEELLADAYRDKI